MAWATAIADLRTLLSDGPTDRIRYRKRCIGEVNGTNKTFKTFEYRRISALIGAAAPLGVYVSGALATVDTEDLTSGEFTLHTAPAATSRQVVDATYYFQLFTDTELGSFLANAGNFLQAGSDPNGIAAGLQPAALQYAAHDAYLKLAHRWTDPMSAVYLMEDLPQGKSALEVATSYRALADSFMKTAQTLRDDFYKRSGQALAPNFISISGAVRDAVPMR